MPSFTASTIIRHDLAREPEVAFESAAKKLGVEVTGIYWTVGDYDGLLALEVPDDETATTAILQPEAEGNVHATTAPAFTAAEMDQIIAKAPLG